MCNNYRLHVPANQLAAPFRDAGRPLTFPGGLPNLEATDYRIGDRAPIVTLDADGPQLTMTPWAWKGPTGKPVFNFRSDGRSFAHSTRCLIPADGFYEFTEPKVAGKKTKWLFTMTGQPWFWIAGIIRDGAFTMLTTEPGPDVAPYHDRQIVVLPPGAGVHWLALSAAEDLILSPCPAGALTVQKVYP
ncbi:MAG: SOS response-associated peptidase family protein [Brevundimonas sp.]|jgi:putative SOS response-associated peptidase YedK|uniref:SOS response-associated peptidase family protein n=1 Tax=Brevundimonas sp. TaxID=1871086 RepID=UPI0025BEBF61|nr:MULTISPECIES: SOS response-associated peptidase family protein [Brevundimonas]MCH4267214.1 SOS response-associated peptidase family protein [Brevundimonas sp.]